MIGSTNVRLELQLGIHRVEKVTRKTHWVLCRASGRALAWASSGTLAWAYSRTLAWACSRWLSLFSCFIK